MRRMIALFVAFIMIFALTSCDNDGRPNAVLHDEDSIYAISYSESFLPIEISSPQCFVYDVENDMIVFAKGQKKVVYPGSTAKLLTALYALTVLSPDEVIAPRDELDLVKEGSSIAYIKKHHKLTVEMLVEGMMLPSGNDAAYALAAAVGRKLEDNDELGGNDAVKAFISGVNEYAESIGLCGTVITVPDGYAYEEQYTTVEDMIIVAELALENDIISKYASLQKASVTYASGHTNNWVNTNLLLDPESVYYSPYATGLKTGSINGEYSLVFSVEFDDGRCYIAGVFGADQKKLRFEDANIIIDHLK